MRVIFVLLLLAGCAPSEKNLWKAVQHCQQGCR
jgi:hypothetical protein